MKGIDVSSHNGKIDGARLKQAGISFIWIKLTEGDGYVNPYFLQQEAQARKNGIKVGFYHFARPDSNSAAREAGFFLSKLKGHLKPGDLLPALDFEHPPANASWAYDWLSRVGKVIGQNPVFYTYSSFLTQMRAGTHLTQYPLWLASYGPNNGARHPVAAVPPYRSIAAHQYTSKGKIPGSGKDDTDVNFAALLAPITYKAPPPPKPKIATWKVVVDGRVLAKATRTPGRFLNVWNVQRHKPSKVSVTKN